jgi:ATP-binding cassette subfamily C protein CydD
LVNGVEKLDAYFSQFLPQLFFSSLIPLLILIFVIQIDLLSTIVFIVTAPLIPIFMVLIGAAADKLSKKQWKQLSLMSAYFLDIIQGMYTIKIFGRSKDILEKLKIINISFKKSSMKVLRVAFVSALVLEVLSTISIAIIAVEIGLRLLNGTMEFQPALFILILAPEFYNPLRQLGARYHAGLEGVAAAERIFTILDAPIDEKKIERKVNLANNINYHSSAITFQGVSYTYKGKNKTAVENLTFRIEPNNTTALIGETGSGKTTTTNLLLKFISPQSGEIKIGGTDLASLKRDEWLNRISLITQSPHLFHLSIKDNLQMAKENATENELIESLKFAKIYDLIKKLPTGINTIVGERGTRFSGGETQRIAIARAYLKDAPILIMDEPTANLDPKIESDLIKNIFEFSRHKTVLIIAHRLNTIMNANKILLYRNGKIVGNGSYDELLKSSKYFTELLSKYKGAT